MSRRYRAPSSIVNTAGLTTAVASKATGDVVRDYLRGRLGAMPNLSSADVDDLCTCWATVRAAGNMRMLRVEQRVNGPYVFQGGRSRFTGGS